jgi:hypothetical protein
MNWPKDIFQGVLSNLLSALMIVGISAGLTYAKSKNMRFADLSQYALSVFTLLAMLFVGLRVFLWISTQIPITPESAEESIRSWIDDFHLPIRKVHDEYSVFQFSVTLSNNHTIGIMELKKNPRLIIMEAHLGIGGQVLQEFSNLSANNKNIVLNDIRTELARLHIPSSNISLPLNNIVLQEYIPISSLNFRSFYDGMNQVDSGLVLIENTLSSEFLRRRSFPSNP